MRILEVREFSFITFVPASRKSDFFYMRLSVGSVVFVSYMPESVGFSLCKFLWKNTLKRSEAGRFLHQTL